MIRSSTEKSRGFCRGFSSFCAVAALVIFFAVMLYLSIISLTETTDMNMNNPMLENVEYHKDNFIFNLLLAALSLAVLLVCRRLIERVSVWIPIAVCLASVLAIGLWWVFSSRSAPTHDSYIVSNAAYLATKGDYSALSTDYFKRFPFQLGYVLFSEIVIRIFGTENNYLSIEAVNVVCLAVSYFAILMLSRRIFKNDNVVKILAFLLLLCFQPILFCTFTYGNIPGFMFASLALWQFVEIKKGKLDWLHALLCALCIGIAVCIKKNFMIVLAAILIIGAVRLIKKKMLCDLICIVLCAVSVPAFGSAVQAHYEARAGVDFGDGIPMLSWLAMGLNESSIAPGWYNGVYTVTNFHNNGMDTDAASDASAEVVRERFELFSEDKQYANDFFGKKIASQWNEPTYQSLWTNQVRGRYGEMGKLAAWALGKGEQTVKGYMNIYQQLIFTLASVAAIVLIKRRRIEDALLPTVILGGFLYHALFEAKSQYAVVYFVLMLPMAAYAAEWVYSFLADRVDLKLKK